MSLLDTLAATRTPAQYGVRVLKSADALAPLSAPVESHKPTINKSLMAVTCVLTTRTPDRQGDIVDPAGGSFAEHIANPVVLFHHAKDHKLPIGKAEDANGNYTVRLVKAQDGDLLVGTTHFAQSNRFAQDVFGLIAEDDVLRGVSIGFDPGASSDAFESLGASPVLDRDAMHFKSWTLLEYSHTPIGVNRDALTARVQKALDGSRKMHPALLKALTPYSKPRLATVAGGAAVQKGAAGCAEPPRPKRTVAINKAKRQGYNAEPLPAAQPPKAGTVTNDAKKAAKQKSAPVRKAMPSDDYEDDDMDDTAESGDTDDTGFDPTQDDPGDDPNMPESMQGDPAQDETPPTIQAMHDAAQGLLDLCAQLEASVQKGEHIPGRKASAKLIADLRAKAAAFSGQADKFHGELNAAGTTGEGDGNPDDDQNAAEDASEPEEPPEEPDDTEPETDEDGALMTKGGYVPRRFTFAELSGAAPAARTPAANSTRPSAREKALEHEVAQLQETLNRVLEDAEAGANRNR